MASTPVTSASDLPTSSSFFGIGDVFGSDVLATSNPPSFGSGEGSSSPVFQAPPAAVQSDAPIPDFSSFLSSESSAPPPSDFSAAPSFLESLSPPDFSSLTSDIGGEGEGFAPPAFNENELADLLSSSQIGGGEEEQQEETPEERSLPNLPSLGLDIKRPSLLSEENWPPYDFSAIAHKSWNKLILGLNIMVDTYISSNNTDLITDLSYGTIIERIAEYLYLLVLDFGNEYLLVDNKVVDGQQLKMLELLVSVKDVVDNFYLNESQISLSYGWFTPVFDGLQEKYSKVITAKKDGVDYYIWSRDLLILSLGYPATPKINSETQVRFLQNIKLGFDVLPPGGNYSLVTIANLLNAAPEDDTPTIKIVDFLSGRYDGWFVKPPFGQTDETYESIMTAMNIFASAMNEEGFPSWIKKNEIPFDPRPPKSIDISPGPKVSTPNFSLAPPSSPVSPNVNVSSTFPSLNPQVSVSPSFSAGSQVSVSPSFSTSPSAGPKFADYMVARTKLAQDHAANNTNHLNAEQEFYKTLERMAIIASKMDKSEQLDQSSRAQLADSIVKAEKYVDIINKEFTAKAEALRSRPDQQQRIQTQYFARFNDFKSMVETIIAGLKELQSRQASSSSAPIKVSTPQGGFVSLQAGTPQMGSSSFPSTVPQMSVTPNLTNPSPQSPLTDAQSKQLEEILADPELSQYRDRLISNGVPQPRRIALVYELLMKRKIEAQILEIDHVTKHPFVDSNGVFVFSVSQMESYLRDVAMKKLATFGINPPPASVPTAEVVSFTLQKIRETPAPVSPSPAPSGPSQQGMFPAIQPNPQQGMFPAIQPSGQQGMFPPAQQNPQVEAKIRELIPQTQSSNGQINMEVVNKMAAFVISKRPQAGSIFQQAFATQNMTTFRDAVIKQLAEVIVLGQ